MKERSEKLDVLIIGAGLSGIDTAYRLQTECSGKTYAILEGRNSLGGTWDLFQYPGIRSDSDVETLGFPFRPWVKEKSIADGPAILQYIKDTAREFSIDQKIRYGWTAVEATWQSSKAIWLVSCKGPEDQLHYIRCRFLYCCTGYYNYAQAYQPVFPGVGSFKGTLIHPQFWPSTFDPTGKTIIIVGSGATAITLLPALAEKAKCVTLLQRSPTYVASRPAIDPISQRIRAWLPKGTAHRLVRLKNILYGISVYRFAKRQPTKIKRILMGIAKKELPPEIDVEKHFHPRYNPWDQRLCLAPDGDFFAAIRSRKARIETDEIECIEANGIRLRSGPLLEADTIVSATGLQLQLIGGMRLYKDSVEINLSEHFNYKGIMMSNLPNFAVAMGYTNASWTLKCDLSARYICRLLNYMDAHGYRSAYPNVSNSSLRAERLLDLSSNYIKRSEGILPKQGDKKPWRLNQNYFLDYLELQWSAMDDGTLTFQSDNKA
jgi:monooxygenase